MSLTDDIYNKMLNKAESSAQQILQGNNPAVRAAGTVIKRTEKAAAGAGKTALKGICLIIKGGAFTTENIMRKTAEVVTGDIKFSKRNLHIDELKKSGRVTMVEDNVTADVMKYFDKHCKKFGVHYTAMKDKADKNNPSYYVFFNNKDSAVILKVMKLAYQDYDKAVKKGLLKTKASNKEGEPRESVKAKLAFFRDRVATRDNEQRNVEKHYHKSEISK